MIHVIAVITAKPGKREEILRHFRTNVPAVRAEPGCISYEACHSQSDSRVFMLCERWASEQAAEQWLRRVPQDPGGLLRRKFLYQYQRLGVDQAGNRVQGAGKEQRPW